MLRWISRLNRLFEVDARRHVRMKADFQATLSGPFGTIEVTGKNGNRDGAGVQSDRPLENGTLVFMRIRELGVMGFAHVRHCSTHEGGYFLGLKFREPLAREHVEVQNWGYQRVAREECGVWDQPEL